MITNSLKVLVSEKNSVIPPSKISVTSLKVIASQLFMLLTHSRKVCFYKTKLNMLTENLRIATSLPSITEVDTFVFSSYLMMYNLSSFAALISSSRKSYLSW